MSNDLSIPRKPGSRRLLIWFVLLGLLVLLGIGGGWWYLNQNRAAAEPAEQVQDNQALYVGMSRPFIFSVPGSGSRDRLVQVSVELLVRGEASETLAKRHLPLLESTLLTVLSGQTAASYLSAQSKDSVKSEALDALNRILVEETGKGLIEQVLFTGVVVQ
ncbi:flagellar basal body-associated protein FliL [Zobellella denitrificans]|nr:flagellar basal body-associated protein FliL [Zobellella denitrificans]